MSSDDEKVVILDCMTRLPIPVKRVIKGAEKADLSSIIVIGWDSEDKLFLSSSEAKKSELLWLLEKAKQCLMDM